MTHDLDQLLGRLSCRAPHPGLDAVSATVLERIAVAPSPRSDAFLMTSAVAALFAVGIGFADGRMQPEQPTMAGLDAGMALAPSTLLSGG
ncbi:hypothetical protein MZO42_17570 [Sphingomonas psychrotolerans]|uniref:Uncharacterized protein n=1 Tax=Sphingomonas psychrotolerans TaxID=1327635 RepID=A0ABU3N7M0_9SPHN|nr:hypothetical protein [Sphingomonas psychrotolerans]MDT8760513.1 hypothetical protein [Sphingomonas psychrotolerans]